MFAFDEVGGADRCGVLNATVISAWREEWVLGRHIRFEGLPEGPAFRAFVPVAYTVPVRIRRPVLVRMTVLVGQQRKGLQAANPDRTK